MRQEEEDWAKAGYRTGKRVRIMGRRTQYFVNEGAYMEKVAQAEVNPRLSAQRNCLICVKMAVGFKLIFLRLIADIKKGAKFAPLLFCA